MSRAWLVAFALFLGTSSCGDRPAFGGPSCSGQSCGGGCCAGTYCWAFTETCVDNTICQGQDAGAGQCSCDGVLTAPCPSGRSCPAPAHGGNTFCCGNTSSSCHAGADCCSGVCNGTVCT